MRDAVTTWFGAFVVEDQQIVATYPFPADRSALSARLKLRREGRLAPEESRLIADHLEGGLRSRDRRLVAAGAKLGHLDFVEPDPTSFGINPAWLREMLLEGAEESLRQAWDPSVHIEEAVRALRDLEESRNLLGERLVSWMARDAHAAEEEVPGTADAAARRLVERAPGEGTVSATHPTLETARRQLAELYMSVSRSSVVIEKTLQERVPEQAPNLSALLGPLLAARMIAQAGGLDRLARLPASTVQVLGAERAFFEHLRGHAPPPRHGLLFLHPEIQGAPRAARGKLARALAGKVAIAARLDHEGQPVRADLSAEFKHRTEEIRAMGSRKPTGARQRGSRAPLDRAAKDR